MKERIIITGGLGYIGSHIIAELGNAHSIKILDNLSNAKKTTVQCLTDIIGVTPEHEILDIRDTKALRKSFLSFKPTIVIHLAGNKSVPESVINPAKYYENNVLGTMSVLNSMEASNCYKIIFSSSATVYGDPKYLPIDENHPTHPINPYGRSKLMAEIIIRDWCSVSNKRKGLSLRYFNPIGAHSSGMLFENGTQKSSNLMPTLLSAGKNSSSLFTVFGNTHDTKDGTGVRDYIHVVDLANAHVEAVKHLSSTEGYVIYNVGTGTGTSVLELLKSFERANDTKVKFKIGSKRSGDVSEVWATADKIFLELGWKAKKSVEQMCKDALKAYKNRSYYE